MSNVSDDDSARDGESVTVEESSSWLQRLGRSLAGIVFGILLVIVACVVLFWNEGHAVKTARSLSEGAGIVKTVAADKPDSTNDGKLVHVIGALTASGPVLDAEFGMKSEGVRLVRNVEMYQWTEDSEQETSKRLGGGETTRTTYKYKRDWADHAVDSSRFHEHSGHTNPHMIWSKRNQAAPNVKLGAFAVPQSMIGRFGDAQPLAVDDAQVQAAKKHTNKDVAVVDGALYVGKDPGQPVVGDYRISYSEVPRQSASVIARQAPGQTSPAFEPYRTNAGGTVALITPGEVPAKDMFKEAQDENRMWTWIIRAGGAVGMFIGFCLMMGPLGVLASVIPILGDVVEAGVGVVALLMTAILAPLVIAIAWFVYRPVVAVIVLVVGGALAYGALHWARTRKAARAAPKAAAAT
jgi:hypothetical protein